MLVIAVPTYISYLLIGNKLSPNLAVKNNKTFIISQSEIQLWLAELLAHDLSAVKLLA